MNNLEEARIYLKKIEEIIISLNNKCDNLAEKINQLEEGNEDTKILNLVKIESNNHSIGLLDNLKISFIYKIYLWYISKYPGARGSIINLWEFFLPLYLKVRLNIFNPSKKWRKLIRMQDFVSKNQCLMTPILSPVNIQMRTPKVLPEEDQGFLTTRHENITFPATYIAELKDALVYGGTNLIFLDNEVIYHDLYDFQKDSTSEELHGRHVINAIDMKISLLQDGGVPAKILECAASFVDACAINYAHWLTEVLPRIALFCDVKQYEMVPIIINADLHPNILESLALIVGPNRKVFALPVGSSIKVENLIQVSVTGYVPFGRRINSMAEHSHGLFNPLALKNLQDKFKNILNVSNNNPSSNLIYLERISDARRLKNDSSIKKILFDKNYLCVNTLNLNFKEQLIIFNNVDQVISSTGAALCNAIFCKKNTKVIVLMGKHEEMIYRYWVNMLDPLGINVEYILGDPVNNSEKSIHRDFLINETLINQLN